MSLAIILCLLNLTLVGKVSRQARQQKCRTLWGMGKDQIFFQTVKFPVEVSAQTSLSAGRVTLKGLLLIKSGS